MHDTTVLVVQLDVSVLERDDPVTFDERERREGIRAKECEEPDTHGDADRDPKPPHNR